MTEPNQVRPIINLAKLATGLLEQVRNYIETAYYAGKADGTGKGRNQVVEWIEANTTEDEFGFRSFNNTRQWQEQLKDWRIE